MKTWKKTLAAWVKKTARALWSHRLCYAALALNYGLGCAQIIDKDMVAQIATGIYAAMVTQKH